MSSAKIVLVLAAPRARRRARCAGPAPRRSRSCRRPGSPISTGLFLVLRDRIWITRRISASRPITGSSLPARRLGDQVAAVLLERLVGAPPGSALVTRWLPRTCGERLEEALAGDAVLAKQPAGRGRPSRSSSSASSRCSTETYSSLQALGLLARRVSSSSLRRRVTYTCPGAAPGPLTRAAGARARCSSAGAQRAAVDASARTSRRGTRPSGWSSSASSRCSTSTSVWP